MAPVRIPPMLRVHVEGQREVLGQGETVRQVLEDVAARYPSIHSHLFERGDLAPFVNVYVGRDDVRTLEGLDTHVGVNPVLLLPAMAGGGSPVVAKRVADNYSPRIMTAHKPVCLFEGLIVRARPR
jgi:sulfur-carrier protein